MKTNWTDNPRKCLVYKKIPAQNNIFILQKAMQQR